jgi:transcription elongation factor Elf1
MPMAKCDKRARNIRIRDQYKKTHPCVVCGENRLPCLDFHHIDGKKEGSVSQMVQRPESKVRLIAEMEKCIIVCANCHRIIHFSESTEWSQKMAAYSCAIKERIEEQSMQLRIF